MKAFRIVLSVHEYALLRKLVDGYGENDLIEMKVDPGDYDLLWHAVMEDTETIDVE